MNFFFFTMEFWLSRSLSHELFLFHDGILTIKKPFTRTFSFSRWNYGYQEAFHTNFFFFTMEFWLSRSLSHKFFLFHDGILAIKETFTQTFSFSPWNSSYQEAFHTRTFPFSQWNFGYQEAFHTNFFFSRWNSSYQGAFHTNFFFFTMEFWLSRRLSHELFCFHDGILAIKKPFTRTFSFSQWRSKNARFGGRLFSYIYHKEYLHRIRLVKKLAS
jgi:hypothetical protein